MKARAHSYIDLAGVLGVSDLEIGNGNFPLCILGANRALALVFAIAPYLYVANSAYIPLRFLKNKVSYMAGMMVNAFGLGYTTVFWFVNYVDFYMIIYKFQYKQRRLKIRNRYKFIKKMFFFYLLGSGET